MVRTSTELTAIKCLGVILALTGCGELDDEQSPEVESRVSDAKQEWQLQWEGERKRLAAEIERLRKAAGPGAVEEKKEAARRALLQKLGKLPTGSAVVPKSAEQWEHE